MTDPQAAAFLRTRKWDGGLPDWLSASDTLMVVDSNVGFNKVDPNVERAIHYQVDLARETGPQARLTLSYRNHSQQPVEACRQEAWYGETYADMMDGCYWDYLRVYVPAGSQLLAGPDLALPMGSLLARKIDAAIEGPINPALISERQAVWTAFFDLAPGQERTLIFEYRLPDRVVVRRPDGTMSYHLRVQKQPGTEAVPLRFDVHLPQGAEVLSGMPAELITEGSVSTDLRTDREFEIVYRTEGIR
jgi:hypothetical protein